jgi:chaperonin GroES
LGKGENSPNSNTIILGGIGMAISLKPLADRVLVEPIEDEEITPGGIVLPETAKEKPQRGKVLAVGPGGRDEDGKVIVMEVAVGNTVLFAKYSGTEIKMDGKKMLIMRQSDLLAIVGGTEAPTKTKALKS